MRLLDRACSPACRRLGVWGGAVAPPLKNVNANVDASATAPSGARDSSGLPSPAVNGLPRPSGAPGDLTVLDWAGFKGAVSWTFDDAQPSHIAHYAELNAVGVPMTFYLTTNNAGGAGFPRHMESAVNDGHELGNHSVHHCRADLTGCMAGRPLLTSPPSSTKRPATSSSKRRKRRSGPRPRPSATAATMTRRRRGSSSIGASRPE